MQQPQRWGMSAELARLQVRWQGHRLCSHRRVRGVLRVWPRIWCEADKSTAQRQRDERCFGASRLWQSGGLIWSVLATSGARPPAAVFILAGPAGDGVCWSRRLRTGCAAALRPVASPDLTRVCCRPWKKHAGFERSFHTRIVICSSMIVEMIVEYTQGGFHGSVWRTSEGGWGCDESNERLQERNALVAGRLIPPLC